MLLAGEVANNKNDIGGKKLDYIHGQKEALDVLKDSGNTLLMLGHGRLAFVLERYLTSNDIKVTGYLSDYENDHVGGGDF